MTSHLGRAESLYVVDAWAGADPAHRIGVRVVTAHPYHALFAKTMFIELAPDEAATFEPTALVLHTPDLEAVPEDDGTRTGTFVVLHPGRTELLVGGTFYAGEIKKSIFTVMNDRLPLEGVFPMHCSANVADDGRVAVFFGLSGTGKTTLSADPERALIGDDEHGWGDTGVFNIEGGCYAKVIRLSAAAEPEIFATTHTYGTILENVVVDENGVLDLDDDSKTENTRAAYKLEQIAQRAAGEAGRSSVDGDLPDRGRVRDPAADRETHPRPGALLLPLRLHRQAGRHRDRRHRAAADVLDLLRSAVPAAAAERLREPARLEARPARLDGLAGQHRAGRAARSARAAACRSRRRARCCARRSPASSTTSSCAPTSTSASACPSPSPGVDSKLLDPRSTWRDPEAYDRKARELAALFADNFATRFADVGEAIRTAGPTRLMAVPPAPWRVVIITVLPVVAQGYSDGDPRASGTSRSR